MYKQAATTYGGDNALPLTGDILGGLSQLFGGSPADKMAQSNPTGKTGGIMGVLSDILSAGGGSTGSTLSQLIQQKQTSDVAGLRQRFAGSGVSMGTPAAVAESRYKAQAGPEAATAIGSLQLQALAPLLGLFSGVLNKGISQRETTNVVQPNPWLEGIKAISGGGQGFGEFMKGLKLV